MAILKILKQSTIVHLCFAISYFLSGVIMSFAQAILYFGLKPFSKYYYRKINYYISYSFYCQLVFMSEWWSGTRVLFYVKKDEYEKFYGKEHGYLIMNHSYEIDWLMGWQFCDSVKVLGNCKAYAKKVIQYLPPIGWMWKFSEFVFLERSFDKDREIIKRQITELCDYPDPVWKPVPEFNDGQANINIDYLFPTEDLYKSAPPSTVPKSPSNVLPPLKSPRSAPLLIGNEQSVPTEDDEDICRENQCNIMSDTKSTLMEPNSPYSDITGINELSSSSIHVFSDSSVSWYPESEEDRQKKKKKKVFIATSSSDSDDEEYSKGNRIQGKKKSPTKQGYTNVAIQASTSNTNISNDTTTLTLTDHNIPTEIQNSMMVQEFPPICENSNDIDTLTRWKKSDPSKWKKNVAKKNKQNCLPYLSKNDKLMPAKLPKDVKCNNKLCRYQCSTHFSQNERNTICANYWKITDFNAQKQYILDKIETQPIKTMKANISKHRTATYAYHFYKNEVKTRVCKDFFMKTLCISNGPINECLSHRDELGHYSGKDNRGIKAPANETSKECQQKIIDHINSFPRLESHYCRKKSKRQYLDSKLTIAKMYELYKLNLTQACEKPCSFYVYKKIFGNKFNLSFFKPKKDLCMICTRYDGAGQPDNLKDEYDMHISRKNAAQEAKEYDKQRSIANDNYLVVTMDMQSTLHIPVSGVGILYYTRKLNVQNFTIHTAKPPHEAFCITWNEIHGKRGCIEIATAMNWWIEQLPDNIKEVTLYSDTCAGQNRNQFITAFLVHLIQRADLALEIIEQKYLESGHTHMEVDSMHSAIERQQRYTPVYSMIDWKTIMRNARSKRNKKSAPPYVVKELTYNEMLDVKTLSQSFIKNMNRDKDGNRIKWLKIKCLRFERQHPGIVKFRYSHEGAYQEFNVFEEPHKSVSLTRKRKRDQEKHGEVHKVVDQEEFRNYSIPKAYSLPLPISEAKKKDLMNLCQKGIIPQELHQWYESLPSNKEVVDRLLEPDATEEGEDDV